MGKPFFHVLAVVLLTPVLLAQGTRVVKTKDLFKPGLYPSRVAAANFEDRVRWGPGNDVGWQAWSVVYPSSAPIASFSKDRVFEYIRIQGLTCRNKVVGDRPCVMQAIQDPTRSTKSWLACSIQVDPDPLFVINCPESLELLQ